MNEKRMKKWTGKESPPPSPFLSEETVWFPPVGTSSQGSRSGGRHKTRRKKEPPSPSHSLQLW
ncbi:hypothetical protein IE53DRAFT_391245 [Violaceomyces palustris]|uniref:Uncharacterized protein n=1 Tax=Violaceomyces palustris TaxID=1673888 RepID=A0ACD0NLB3_9BASI|nr:hypothetical protein IE53DRAFT_391245 [Violaceomyces palustris]